jgi:hypothetical protein
MTINEKQMYPSIQAKIWGSLGQVGISLLGSQCGCWPIYQPTSILDVIEPVQYSSISPVCCYWGRTVLVHQPSLLLLWPYSTRPTAQSAVIEAVQYSSISPVCCYWGRTVLVHQASLLLALFYCWFRIWEMAEGFSGLTVQDVIEALSDIMRVCYPLMYNRYNNSLCQRPCTFQIATSYHASHLKIMKNVSLRVSVEREVVVWLKKMLAFLNRNYLRQIR